MRIASITPAHRSCSTTIGMSKALGDLSLFGLMQRTYCTDVFSIVAMSELSCDLNLVVTLAAATEPLMRRPPLGCSASAAEGAGAANTLARIVFADERISRVRSSKERVLVLLEPPLDRVLDGARVVLDREVDARGLAPRERGVALVQRLELRDEAVVRPVGAHALLVDHIDEAHAPVDQREHRRVARELDALPRDALGLVLLLHRLEEVERELLPSDTRSFA